MAPPTDPRSPAPVADRSPSRRRRLGLVVALGLVVTLVLAIFVSPFASSEPDGLEKVAAEQGIDRDADEHALADSPLADYGVEGVGSARVGTGLAGLIGVGVTFVVGVGLFLALRQRQGQPSPLRHG